MNHARNVISKLEATTAYRLDTAARERPTLDIDSALLTLRYLIESRQWERARELRAEIKAQHGL